MGRNIFGLVFVGIELELEFHRMEHSVRRDE
jgi:hypothetical protein